MTTKKSGAGGPVATGFDRGCRKGKRCDKKGKTLRLGIMCKGPNSYQVELRPKGSGGHWKFHFGTYATLAGANVARDFYTFLMASNKGDTEAGDYHFPEAVRMFEEFERTQDPQVSDLFRIVCDKFVNNRPKGTHSTGAVSPGKSKSSGSKDLDLQLLNEKARVGIKQMMGKFEESYPSEFLISTGISETFTCESETRGNEVQTNHPFYTGAPSLRDIDPAELLTNEQWIRLGELQKIEGDEYIVSFIRYHYHRVQGLASSLHRELDSDPQVAGNYPLSSNKPLQSLPVTLQGRTPDSAVGWTHGKPSIPPSLSIGTWDSTSLVQQQFSSEVERRDHNGHLNLQESTLFPAQQKLSNQAFLDLDEVLKEPLPNAHLDPKGIAVIDNPFVSSGHSVNVSPRSLSVGTWDSTSLVQQQFLFEVERRDHNGHHNLQESTLFPAQQELSNQAFLDLDEVMKEPLPNAHLDPNGIAVIDNPFVSSDHSVNVSPRSLSVGTWDSTSLVQQQFLFEVEQRDHNGHHNLQESTLFPAQQELSNQAYLDLDEVMKEPLRNAHLDPNGIAVIDNLFVRSDHCVNVSPRSLSVGTWDSTSLVQQQFSSEVERRDHNGHHNLQESTLFPAQQELSNQAFLDLDEVVKEPLRNAHLDPNGIAVIDNPFVRSDHSVNVSPRSLSVGTWDSTSLVQQQFLFEVEQKDHNGHHNLQESTLFPAQQELSNQAFLDLVEVMKEPLRNAHLDPNGIAVIDNPFVSSDHSVNSFDDSSQWDYTKEVN